MLLLYIDVRQFLPVLLAVVEGVELPVEADVYVRVLTQEQMHEVTKLRAKYQKGYTANEGHCQFKYDTEYFGGDYIVENVSYEYVPKYLIETFGSEVAFYIVTGLNPLHILHVNIDLGYRYDASGKELYDKDGTLLDDESDDQEHL